MAKLSARGARQVCRVTVRSQAGYRYLFEMSSDGRILSRWLDMAGEGWKVTARRPKDRATRETLMRYLAYRGYTLID